MQASSKTLSLCCYGVRTTVDRDASPIQISSKSVNALWDSNFTIFRQQNYGPHFTHTSAHTSENFGPRFTHWRSACPHFTRGHAVSQYIRKRNRKFHNKLPEFIRLMQKYAWESWALLLTAIFVSVQPFFYVKNNYATNLPPPLRQNHTNRNVTLTDAGSAAYTWNKFDKSAICIHFHHLLSVLYSTPSSVQNLSRHIKNLSCQLFQPFYSIYEYFCTSWRKHGFVGSFLFITSINIVSSYQQSEWFL